MALLTVDDKCKIHSCFLVDVGLRKLATEIVQAFEGIETERPVKVQKVYQC